MTSMASSGNRPTHKVAVSQAAVLAVSLVAAHRLKVSTSHRSALAMAVSPVSSRTFSAVAHGHRAGAAHPIVGR